MEAEPSHHPTDGESQTKAPTTENGTGKATKVKASAAKVSPTKNSLQNQVKGVEKKPLPNSRPATAKPLGNGVLKKAEGPDKKSTNAAPKPRVGNPAPSGTAVKKVPAAKPNGEGILANGKKVEKAVGVKNGDQTQSKPARTSTGKPTTSTTKQPTGPKPAAPVTVKTAPVKPERPGTARPAPTRNTPVTRPSSSTAAAASTRTATPPSAGRGPAKDKPLSAKPKPAAPSGARTTAATPERPKIDATKKDVSKVSTPTKGSTPTSVPKKSVTPAKVVPAKVPKPATETKTDVKTKGPVTSTTPKATDRTRQPLNAGSPAPKTLTTKPGSAASPTKQVATQKALSTTPKRSTKSASGKPTPKKEPVYSLEPVAVPRRKNQSLDSPAAEDVTKPLLAEDKVVEKVSVTNLAAIESSLEESPFTPSVDALPLGGAQAKTDTCQIPESGDILSADLENHSALDKIPTYPAEDAGTLVHGLTEEPTNDQITTPIEHAKPVNNCNELGTEAEEQLLMDLPAQQSLPEHNQEPLSAEKCSPLLEERPQELPPQMSPMQPCFPGNLSLEANEAAANAESKLPESEEQITSAEKSYSVEGSLETVSVPSTVIDEGVLGAETKFPESEEIPYDDHPPFLERTTEADLNTSPFTSSVEIEDNSAYVAAKLLEAECDISGDDSFENTAVSDLNVPVLVPSVAVDENPPCAEPKMPYLEDHLPNDRGLSLDSLERTAEADINVPIEVSSVVVGTGPPTAETILASAEEDFYFDHAESTVGIAPALFPSVAVDDTPPCGVPTLPKEAEEAAIDTCSQSRESTETGPSAPILDDYVAVEENLACVSTMMPTLEAVEKPNESHSLSLDWAENRPDELLICRDPYADIQNTLIPPLEAKDSHTEDMVSQSTVSQVAAPEEEGPLLQSEVKKVEETDVTPEQPTECDLHLEEPDCLAVLENSKGSLLLNEMSDGSEETITENDGLEHQVADQAPELVPEDKVHIEEANPIQDAMDEEPSIECSTVLPDFVGQVIVTEEKAKVSKTTVDEYCTLKETSVPAYDALTKEEFSEKRETESSQEIDYLHSSSEERGFSESSFPEMELLDKNTAEVAFVGTLTTSLAQSQGDFEDESINAYQFLSLNPAQESRDILVSDSYEEHVDEKCDKSLETIEREPLPIFGGLSDSLPEAHPSEYHQPEMLGQTTEQVTDVGAPEIITSSCLELSSTLLTPFCPEDLSAEVSLINEGPQSYEAAEYISIGSPMSTFPVEGAGVVKVEELTMPSTPPDDVPPHVTTVEIEEGNLQSQDDPECTDPVLTHESEDMVHKPHNLPLETADVSLELNGNPLSPYEGNMQSPSSESRGALQEQSPEKVSSKSSTLSGPDLAGKSSSETSTPEELRDYDSSSGVESKSEDKLGGTGDLAFAQSQQPFSPLDDLPADQDLGIHMEKGDDEAETLPADEVLGDPHTEPTVSSEEHSEAEIDGDLSLNGSTKCPAFEKLVQPSVEFNKSKPLVSLASPPCKPSLFHSVEESEELGSGDAGTETPASTNSAGSYDVFDGAFHLHSTDSCGKSPGVSSLDSEEHVLEGSRDQFLVGPQREIGFSVDTYALPKEEYHRTPSEDEDSPHHPALPPEPAGWKQEFLGSGSIGWGQQLEQSPSCGEHVENLQGFTGQSSDEPQWVAQPTPLATYRQKDLECDLMPTADMHTAAQSYSATTGVGTDNMTTGVGRTPPEPFLRAQGLGPPEILSTIYEVDPPAETGLLQAEPLPQAQKQEDSTLTEMNLGSLQANVVQQLISRTLLFTAGGSGEVLSKGVMSEVELGKWTELLSPLEESRASITSVTSFSPEDIASPQGDWTVVEVETFH
ncbi:mucin-17-like [Pleurodeles waltl]|uniref:mucin-17-like n=1 Tax=Pleurodeles waltl TaxID=8319 RepID=UPI0037094C7D